MDNLKVGFIGFGNMAQAMARGLVATGALAPEAIGACARDFGKLRRNTEPSGFTTLPVKFGQKLAKSHNIRVL